MFPSTCSECCGGKGKHLASAHSLLGLHADLCGGHKKASAMDELGELTESCQIYCALYKKLQARGAHCSTALKGGTLHCL